MRSPLGDRFLIVHNIMANKIIRQLNFYYYGIVALTLVGAVVSYLLITRGIVLPIDRMSTLGRTIQYVVIMDAMATIPLGLYWFSCVCKRLAKMEDEEERDRLYGKYAAIRIVLVSNTMVLGIIAFYLMSCYSSMLWLTGIAAIAWTFTKPTEKKMYLELHPEEEKY